MGYTMQGKDHILAYSDIRLCMCHFNDIDGVTATFKYTYFQS